jgi:hypothetical protein
MPPEKIESQAPQVFQYPPAHPIPKMSNLIDSEMAILQKRLNELTAMKVKFAEEIDYEAFLPDERDYERMQSIHDHYDEMTFHEFISWNIECIQKQTKEEEAWLNTLCARLSRHRIKTMDLESCSEFVATGFYFDQHARLIIYNPR